MPYTRTVDVPAPIAPPAVIGILGGGQLGRMLAMAARAMGYRVAVLDPDASCPAAAVADEVVVGGDDDAGAARRLGGMRGLMTYELGHGGGDVVAASAAIVPVGPGVRPLLVAHGPRPGRP